MLVPAGAVLALLGIGVIAWGGWRIWRGKAQGINAAELRQRMANFVPLNLAGLGVAAIGLMLVVMGLLLH